VSAPLKRASLPGGAPAGLVDVKRRGGADLAEQVLVGLAGRRGRALQDRLDRARGDAGSEQLTHKLDRVTARDAVSDREAGDRCLEARAEGSPRHVGRQLGARRGAALRAAQALQAMLAEEHRGRRQLHDLMARGLANGATLCLAESVAAGAAGGPVVDRLVERLNRRQMTTASRVARLGAGPPARSRLTRPRWRRGRILAGGQRGVARVSVAALFKVGDADLKPPVRLAQLGDLSPEQSVLRRELQEHSDDRLTSLLIDRLSLGAFHAQGLRGAGGRACLCPLGRLLLGGLG